MSNPTRQCRPPLRPAELGKRISMRVALPIQQLPQAPRCCSPKEPGELERATVQAKCAYIALSILRWLDWRCIGKNLEYYKDPKLLRATALLQRTAGRQAVPRVLPFRRGEADHRAEFVLFPFSIIAQLATSSRGIILHPRWADASSPDARLAVVSPAVRPRPIAQPGAKWYNWPSPLPGPSAGNGRPGHYTVQVPLSVRPTGPRERSCRCQ